MEEITIDQIRKEAECAEHNWFEKFALTAHENSTDEAQSSPTKSAILWAHIWIGPHGTFGETELIPGTTVVVSSTSGPVFYTPAEIMKKFTFIQKCPITYNSEPRDRTYGESLRRIIRKISTATLKQEHNC